jgi:DNA invertase Pin-like site-specific DNA recombinase
MNSDSKVTATHLQRAAYLYIRQSTLRQVLENTESTQRQYNLRRQAVALGWPEDRIVVIDHDQAQSAASAADREGFQRLVADVGLGKAGLVMGLEVSRLARNCADWHRLLEICALTHTLILDEDGLYDPAHYNDRLLLGLKGTMSEAELHILKARLVGGVLSKAQRAELKMPLPIGLVYDDDDRVVLDPDQQVQQSLRMFFSTFERTGSAWATVQAFRREAWKFPKRGQAGTGGLSGKPFPTTSPWTPCIIPDTRAPFASVAKGPGGTWRGKSIASSCPASNGVSSSGRPTRAISPGISSWLMNNGCSKTNRRMAEANAKPDRHAKAPPCCRDWCSAASAAPP